MGTLFLTLTQLCSQKNNMISVYRKQDNWPLNYYQGGPGVLVGSLDGEMLTEKRVCLLGGVEPEDTAHPRLMGRKGVLLAKARRTPGSFPEQCLSELQSWWSFNLWKQACSGFPGGSDGKESARSAEDLASIPGSGRSPGGGDGDPLQYSCLENPMDRGAWQATVHGVEKSPKQLKWRSMHAVPMVAVLSGHCSIDGGGVSFLPTLSTLGSL